MVQKMTDAAHPVDQSESLRNPKWGLCWSNSGISDDVLIRKVLVSGRFSVILQACLEFGLDHVKAQWDIVAKDVTEDPRLTSIRTRSLVNDILANIAEGFSRAGS